MSTSTVTRAALAAAAALALAACASTASPASHHVPASHVSASPTAAASSPSAAEAAKAVAAANDRAFVQYLSGPPTDAGPARPLVAGPVMTHYAVEQANTAQAWASSGSPIPGESVSTIPGGYNLCGDNGNGGTTCQALTVFQHNAAGKITGLSVNGQPIAGRLAFGPSNHGSALTITHVVAYRPAAASQVWIVFNVKNTGSTAYTDSPPFLGQFNTATATYSEDDLSGYTIYPQSLSPGQSAVMVEAFDTREVEGVFSLRTNDGYSTVLAGTTLAKP